MSLLILFKSNGTTYFQSMAATAVGVATITMKSRYSKVLAAVAVGVATLSATLFFKRTLAAVAVGVAVFNKVTIFAGGAVARFRTMVGMGQ